MGRFGQALLNGGALDGKRILKSETPMYTPQFRGSNQMPPICMGFYETGEMVCTGSATRAI
jgi:hypothetical protein